MKNKDLITLIKLETQQLYNPPKIYGVGSAIIGQSSNDMLNRIHVLRKNLLQLDKQIEFQDEETTNE